MKNIPRVVKASQNASNNIREIIIVDDGSKDNSIGYLKESFPQIRLIKHRKNRGFSAAVNSGARATKYQLICLLNNDVFPSVNFLKYSVKHFDNEKVFGVSFHEEGYGWAKGKFKNGFITHEGVNEDKKPHETFWVNGGSGLFRRTYWMKLGGMDEKLLPPFYWEDVDISYRAAKRGYINIWEPNSKVVHVHESTIKQFKISKRRRIQERNQLVFIWKNLTSPMLFRRHLVALLGKLSHHPGYMKIVILAVFKIRGIRKARRKERKESKVSDEAIFAKFK